VSLQDGKSGRTPLHYAVEKDDIALCGYLLVDVSCYYGDAIMG